MDPTIDASRLTEAQFQAMTSLFKSSKPDAFAQATLDASEPVKENRIAELQAQHEAEKAIYNARIAALEARLSPGVSS